MKKIFSLCTLFAVALAMTSCSSDTEEIENEGYLMLGVETNASLMTRAEAPSNYNAKTLHVEVKDASGKIYASTDDFTNDPNLNGAQILLRPGQYTVVAHSANWDGSGSGFNAPYYYGETSVTVKAKTLTTAKVVCTQANVKVTVNYSNEFKESFARASTTIESTVTDVNPRVFTMGQDKGSAFFPVGQLTATLSVTNKSGQGYSMTKEFTEVNARDHFILNYTVAPHGQQGGVTVKVDPNTNTYTYNFEVPRKGGTSLAAYTPNAWSTFAYISGKITSKKSDFDATQLALQYKTADANEWTTVAASALTLTGDDISYQLKGLNPSTAYVYRLAYNLGGDDETLSQETTFTTEAQTALYNGGFEDWYSVGNYSSPNIDANTKYWDTSNPGSASFNYVVSYPETSFVHGGSKSARLHAAYAVIKLAAGSIYTGQFGKVSGTSASLNWGVPFTARPTALHGFRCYNPGTINRGDQPSGVGAPASGSQDVGIIRIALMTEQLAVNNKDMSTFPNWDTDPRIIAYGVLDLTTNDNNQWVEFTIPLEYHSLTAKPAYILVMGATCKYGDYFYGSDNSELFLDDFELVYGDQPTVKE